MLYSSNSDRRGRYGVVRTGTMVQSARSKTEKKLSNFSRSCFLQSRLLIRHQNRGPNSFISIPCFVRNIESILVSAKVQPIKSISKTSSSWLVVAGQPGRISFGQLCHSIPSMPTKHGEHERKCMWENIAWFCG